LLIARKFIKYYYQDVIYYIVLKKTTGSSIEILIEYLDYSNVFSNIFSGILAVYHPIEYQIDLEPGTSLPWGPVYPLSESELTILREYLESNKIKGWIRKSISPTGAPIMFVPKKRGSLRLYIDYRGLNITTIKNQTPLSFISKTLDRLRYSKIFIKFDLKDTYYRLRIRERNK
jgi:hypothetical protein